MTFDLKAQLARQENELAALIARNAPRDELDKLRAAIQATLLALQGEEGGGSGRGSKPLRRRM